MSAVCCHGGENSVFLKKFQEVSCRVLLIGAVKQSAGIVGSLFILWEDNNEQFCNFHLPCNAFLVVLMIVSPSHIFHLCLDSVYRVSVPRG